MKNSKKYKHWHSSSHRKHSTQIGKSKGKKSPKDFFMKYMFTNFQAEMINVRVIVAKAQFSYMKELRQLGIDFEEVKKMVEKEFPSIANLLNSSYLDLSSSSEDKGL
ncbi:hypothetical protein VP01_386g11 [Puccinia sorghi]|uniref:Uncharacterized protein n=1 Tax=Puccinia sorghi TaxID=27349 RepID=A0A0L6UTT5_9BASI|nr:hypothetical protein VP01_386g11 [Puccinia sorghi]